MRTTDTGTFQMLWDCPRCGAEKLLGLDHRHCPACGSPQDPERRYFPADDDKVAVENHTFAGADRVCPACETANGAKAGFCGGCGSPLTEAAPVRRRGDQVADEGEDFAADAADAARDEHDSARKADRGSGFDESDDDLEWRTGAYGRAEARRTLLTLLVLALCAAVCGGVVAFWTRDAALAVAGHSWERAVAVEEYKTVRDSAWDEAVPAGARDVSCRRVQRGSTQVADGQTCSTRRKDNGDGTYSQSRECSTKYRSDPSYDNQCSYTVDTWVLVGKERTAGQSLEDPPVWPTVRTSRTRREGAYAETYTLHLTDADGEGSYACETTEDAWRSFAKGQRVAGTVGVLTGAVDCDGLQPLP